jgi:AGZA family xanthine/uracil permease-like MFS transporter
LFAAPLAQATPEGRDRAGTGIGGRDDDGCAGGSELQDPAEGIPAFLAAIMVPLSYSIANGLAFGIVLCVARLVYLT